MPALIVDASVAIKWVIEEEGANKARELLRSGVLAAPDLLFIECANVLWRLAKRGLISVENAKMAFEAIEAVPIRTIPTRPHAAAAQTAAIELDCTAYDSLYLMVALAERAMLVTADHVFARKVAAHAVYRNSVRSL